MNVDMKLSLYLFTVILLAGTLVTGGMSMAAEELESEIPWEDTGGSWGDPSTWVLSPQPGEGQFETAPGPRWRLDFFREFAASIFGPDEASTVAEAVENKGNPAAQIIFSIVSILLSFLGGVSVLFGVYAAFLWMTAGGNEETIGKARTLLLNAVMGLVLILSALLLAIYLETTVAGVNRVDLGGKTGGFCSDDRGPIGRTVAGVLTLGATEIYCEGSYMPAAP